MMNIKFRTAKEEDSELLAWAMLKSSRSGKKLSTFDLIFETSDEKVLLEKLAQLTKTKAKSSNHFSNFMIASVGGKDAAVLCGYEPRIATEAKLSEALSELGVDETYLERIAAFSNCDTVLDRRTWMLDYMEELSEFDQVEILKELVQKSLLTARLKGYRNTQTFVEIDCVDAELVYEKLGFRLKSEHRCEHYSDQFGRAGIKRLEMHL